MVWLLIEIFPEFITFVSSLFHIISTRLDRKRLIAAFESLVLRTLVNFECLKFMLRHVFLCKYHFTSSVVLRTYTQRIIVFQLQAIKT